MKYEYAIYVKEETVIESIFKDFVTLVMIGFCVYISQDSTWWTFITGLMFLLFSFIKISILISKHKNTFRTKEDLQKWVDKLEES